jgi:hypothetical protein
MQPEYHHDLNRNPRPRWMNKKMENRARKVALAASEGRY